MKKLNKCLKCGKETYNNNKIVRQHTVGGYFIDGYCPALNLAIEIDEPSHYNNFNSTLNDKDIKRQTYIEELTGYDFLRIKIPWVY